MVKTAPLCLVLAGISVALAEVQEATEGEPYTLLCPDADPAGAAEFWLHPSGRQLTSQGGDSNYTLAATNLTIKSVLQRDAGRFTCILRAGGGILSSSSVEVAVKSSDTPYWKNHGTSAALAVVAALLFLVGCGVIYFTHQYRYERRNKSSGGEVNGAGYSGGGHSNPALDIATESSIQYPAGDVEAETHM